MATNNAVNTTLSGQTGTGSFVGSTSPTLVTPTLGLATATSINFGGSTLANYVVSTWTPTFTFATPGNLSVAYAGQAGYYIRIGSMVILQFSYAVTPTYTTASGNAQITGLPFASSSSNIATGVINTNGPTFPASTTFLHPVINPSVSFMIVQASGPGFTSSFLTTTNMATGSTYALYGEIVYFI